MGKEEEKQVAVTGDELVSSIVDEIAPIIITGAKGHLRLHYDVGSVIKDKAQQQREATGEEQMKKGFYEGIAEGLSLVVNKDKGTYSHATVRNWERMAKAFTSEEFEKLLEIPFISFVRVLAVVERDQQLPTFEDKFNYLMDTCEMSANEMKAKISEDFPSTRGVEGPGGEGGEGGGSDPGVNPQSLSLKIGKHAEPLMSDLSDLTVSLKGEPPFLNTEKERKNFVERLDSARDILDNLVESSSAVIDLIKGFTFSPEKEVEVEVVESSPPEEPRAKDAKKGKAKDTEKKDPPENSAVAEAIAKSKKARDQAREKHKK